MKKLTTAILAVAVMAGGSAGTRAAAQNPDAIDNARSTAKSLQQKQANDSAKPAPGAPSAAVKPAAIPASQPAAKPAVAPAAQASAQHNQLQRVNVAQGSDGVRVEMTSSGAVTPRVSKLDSPARLLVELPSTVDATPQNHVAVGSAGVKGVRIGMDGKTPPTTSVVVDLEKACTYELTPGPAGKMVLTLHTQGSAPAVAQAATKTAAPAMAKTVAQAATKSNPAPVSAPKPVAQLQTVAKTVAAPAKPQPAAAQPTVTTKPAVAAKPAAEPKPPVVAMAVAKPALAQKQAKGSKDAKAAPAAKASAKTAPAVDASKVADAFKPRPEEKKAEEKKAEEKKAEDKKEDKKWAMSGKRDPFFSPVVQQQGGSGCSTGKKCLEIGNINLRGVVKSDNGFIAVVTNSLNKAYFLRENDPVFNGYVMKITGDSVVFEETVQDKLGKPFTREVVKRIFTPAV